MEVARRYAHGPRAALRGAKIAVNWGARGDFRSGIVLERELFADLFSTEDQKEGMRSLLAHGPGKAKFSGRQRRRRPRSGPLRRPIASLGCPRSRRGLSRKAAQTPSC